MLQILGNPNEIILPCPYCKKNDKKITPIFIYDSKTVKCGSCGKEYTIEIFKVPGSPQAMVNIVPLVREDYNQRIFDNHCRIGLIEQEIESMHDAAMGEDI